MYLTAEAVLAVIGVVLTVTVVVPPSDQSTVAKRLPCGVQVLRAQLGPVLLVVRPYPFVLRGLLCRVKAVQVPLFETVSWVVLTPVLASVRLAV